MKYFQGKVAVITGGASGIGRALAERFAEEGMRIVLADVEETALAKTASEMQAEGAKVLAVVCDVSKKEDVERLAQKTIETFGTVHIMCNNAGVGSGGTTWEIPLEDWDWVLGVNLWGVIHGIHYFTPIMLENNDPCHIINTASFAGLTNGVYMTPYHVSKNSVVSISESMHKELAMMESKVKVSVLCPGWVNTRIHESARNKPDDVADIEEGGIEAHHNAMIKERIEAGLSAESIAQMVMDAVVNETFYILPHPEWNPLIETRMQDILEGRNPTIANPPES